MRFDEILKTNLRRLRILKKNISFSFVVLVRNFKTKRDISSNFVSLIENLNFTCLLGNEIVFF